jgi:carbamoyl-phosphate synthase large subunit
MTRSAEGPTTLVTGAGSSTGVSIFKALRLSALSPRIVATDAQPVSSGLYRADVGYVLPWVRDLEAYIGSLTRICRDELVDLICLGSEAEVRGLAAHREVIEAESGARVVVNDARHIDTFMDKLLMVEALAGRGFPVPDSAAADDPDASRRFVARHDPPFMLKGRRSSGSKQVFVIKRMDELASLARSVPSPMLQEYLRPDDEEYTVGVFKSPTRGFVGQIVLHRSMAAGLTYKAEVVQDPEIERVCRSVVEAFDIWGPVNLQLRKTDAGVRIFEINLRFSSSAVMRAHFGFNEPELCLRELVLGERLGQPELRLGVALRYWDELYLEPGEAATPGTEKVARGGRTLGVF